MMTEPVTIELFFSKAIGGRMCLAQTFGLHLRWGQARLVRTKGDSGAISAKTRILPCAVQTVRMMIPWPSLRIASSRHHQPLLVQPQH
jgi:hypothetical protein